MKAFLLAAGEGTRLRPLTNDRPKCLVPICGVPLLSIWLRWCEQYGIDEVLLNSHSHGEQVRKFIAEYTGSVRVALAHEKELLGSAGTLLRNKEFVLGESEFAILYADVLTSCRFDRLLNFHRLRNAPVTVGTYRVPNPTECGILTADENGLIHEFTEKPQNPSGDMAFSGILVGGPVLLQALPDKVPADIGFDLLPRLLGSMYSHPIDEFLLDIGTLEKYDRAQKEWPAAARKAKLM